MKYEKTHELEIAISNFFDYRVNLIVPNVYWGFLAYECDLLVVSKAGYTKEIEIKVSKADLKKDKEKWHNHNSKKIKQLFFAIPEKLGIDFALEHIPNKAGLIVVDKFGRCKVVKSAKINTKAEKISIEDRLKIAHLGSMRIWNLKWKLIDEKNKLNKARLA